MNDPLDEHDFFLIVAPGLENLAARELKFWLPNPATLLKGGLQLKATLADGFRLNRCLKIPTRILLRLGQFRCRDFPTLFRRLTQFNWRDFVAQGQVHWEVS